MTKILRLIAYILALNFLALGGALEYLWRSGHLDHERVMQIKEIMFSTTQPTTEPVATTQPVAESSAANGLDAVLEKAVVGTPAEQVDSLQRSFDARMAQIDVRQRQLADQQHEVDVGRQRLEAEKAALEASRKDLASAQAAAASEASDQGFQDTLTLYETMAAPQVKAVFATLKDDVVVRYLEAMPPKNAAKIIKQFKTPDELNRIQRIMERMRDPSASVDQSTGK
jgi:flagellar motility protein MotE (MotC chaperone)